MPGSLPEHLQQLCCSKPSEQSQYDTEANAFPSQPELNNNWSKGRRGR
jgi:hypothetical protein